MKRYLTLVEDTEIKDVLLFVIAANSPDAARAKARQHYRDNLWNEQTVGRMRAVLLKENRNVQYIGKAGIDTEEKQKQLQAAYELLTHRQHDGWKARVIRRPMMIFSPFFGNRQRGAKSLKPICTKRGPYESR